MKTVVFAYHDMGCLGIEALLAAGYEISAIFTHTDNPGEKAFYGSVARLAAERGIPVYATDDVNHPLWVERIAQLSPDVIFSFYYRHLICDEILQLAPAGAFNLHGSLLPKYRGRAPLNDAPRDKCTLSCAINGIHAAFHYLKKNYISGCVMTVPTGW